MAFQNRQELETFLSEDEKPFVSRNELRSFLQSTKEERKETFLPQQSLEAPQLSPQSGIGIQDTTDADSTDTEFEQNPLKSLGKSIWNVLSYQLPSTLAGMAASGPIKGKLKVTTPDKGRFIPELGVFVEGKPTEEEGVEARQELLGWAIDRESEGAEFTGDLIQSLEQVDSPIDALNWASSALGQGIAQIPLSVATGGLTSIGQEIGSIYLGAVQKIAEEKGITPEEVIEQNLDDPASSLVYGVGAGALDRIGAGRVMKAFGKKELQDELRSRVRGILVDGVLTEGITEGAQTVIEQIGEARGAGESWADAIDNVDPWEVLNAAATGAVAGGGISSIGEAIQRPTKSREDVEIEEEIIDQPDVQENVSQEDVDQPDEILDSEEISKINREILDEITREAQDVKEKAETKTEAAETETVLGRQEPETVKPEAEKVTEVTSKPVETKKVEADLERKPGQKLTREDVVKQVESLGLPKEQTDAQMKLFDARAEAWSRETGRPAEEWFTEKIAGVQRSKPEDLADDALKQEPPTNLNYQEDVRGFHNGQTDVTLHATDDKGEFVGGVDYSIYEDEVHIDMVAVPESKRRQGIGIGLIDELKRQNPGKKLNWGMTTPEGTALKKSYEAREKAKTLLQRPEILPASLRSAKGAVEFLAEDNRVIIHAFESADISTLAHESAHIFRRDLSGDDLSKAEAWAGVEDGVWTEESEEKFARGFERYLATGKSPNKELRVVFEQFKQWLVDIYRGLKGSQIDVRLGKDIRQVFENLLGGKDQKFEVQRTALDDVIDSGIRLTDSDYFIRAGKARLREEMRELKNVLPGRAFTSRAGAKTLDEHATDMELTENELRQKLLQYESPTRRAGRLAEEAKEFEKSQLKPKDDIRIDDDGMLVVNGVVMFQDVRYDQPPEKGAKPQGRLDLKDQKTLPSGKIKTVPFKEKGTLFEKRPEPPKDTGQTTLFQSGAQTNVIDKKYKRATDAIEGYEILEEIPNMDSISASLEDYEILSGVREIPITEFESDPKDLFYAADDMKRTRELAEEIKQNKEISPLIVVYELRNMEEGPYILEGAHRLGALHLIGAKKIPALVIIDTEGSEVAIIDPTQIKSATGNRGTFDPDNPSILLQAGDNIEHLKDQAKYVILKTIGEKKSRTIIDAMNGDIKTPKKITTDQIQELRQAVLSINEDIANDPSLEKNPLVMKLYNNLMAVLPTSGRKESLKFDRAVLGLDALNSPQRKSWETALNNAIDKKIPEKALRLADSIIDNPRSLSDDETAGLTLKLNDLKKEHRSAHNSLSNMTDEANRKTKAAEIERIEEEFDRISTAVRLSGTEKGRALASQKLTLNEDYDLVSVVNRAKVAKSKDLSAKQRAKFEKMTQKLDAQEKQITELQKKLDRVTAVRTVKSKNRFTRMTGSQRKSAYEKAIERAKQLLKEGCEISG